MHLSDGTVLDIPNAGMVIVGPSTAVLPTRFTEDDESNRLAARWRTIDLIHIVQFSDLDEKSNGKRRRKR